MPRIPKRIRLLLLVAILLVGGFLSTSIASYVVSRDALRDGLIGSALPLTGDNIYSEIQKDMLRPVFISSQMAHDTFVRDWLLAGEQDPTQLTRFLQEVKHKNGTYSSFLVSAKTLRYYYGGGILKSVAPDDQRDAWFFRVANMPQEFETNVDPDLANRDKMTIFINYKIFDYAGQFIGVTGVGITLDSMRHLLQNYEARFQRRVYFVDQAGQVMLTGDTQQTRASILQQAGISQVAAKILNHQTEPIAVTYSLNDQLILLNTRFIPELGWYLIVEQNETADLRPVQRMFQFNLLISALVTLLVLCIAMYSINRSQRYLETLARTDGLTRLLNRRAFEVVLTQKLSELSRRPRPVSGILVDIDYFKQVNDQFGHTTGDAVLQQVAQLLRASARAGDTVARWGGEEFVILLDDCPKAQALELAERLRLKVAHFDFALPDSFRVTVSLGVVELQPGETEIEFFQRADQLLYAAKSSGRNCVMADV
ncbi:MULTISPECIES: sensor domain-containing diguanylate cyclase [Deefgea]|uniref:diguanylate cyclase n=1 Tax=Deefgea chitinilytica TaxID=570276 RepID=A0ABS2C843_9NEIS|nr:MULTISPECIES: sensor domain-containing diguanylate cyclase [Deefgea]MBM5570315.1 diguanylate cyclase [Deefgea chitinilytica]MBM9887544.1 diguanylate cyclase [Deefgea sp. CFH1-16]